MEEPKINGALRDLNLWLNMPPSDLIDAAVPSEDVAVVKTASGGSLHREPNPSTENNQPSLYQIEVVYYGDSALNFSLVDVLPDGTKAALFTTLQYFGYKPSAATAWLTVEPQAAHALTQTKTPEQLQAEAEQAGWLSIWHSLHGGGILPPTCRSEHESVC